MAKVRNQTEDVADIVTPTEDVTPVEAQVMTKNVIVKYVIKSNVLHNNVMYTEGDEVDSVPTSFLEKEWAEKVEKII